MENIDNELQPSKSGIIELLAQETEYKEPPKVEEVKEEIEAEEVEQIEEEKAQDEKQKFNLDPSEMAGSIIDIFDYVQTLILPPLHEKTLFTKEERENLNEILEKAHKAKKEGAKVTLDFKDKSVIERWEKNEKYRAKVPLKDPEKEMLRKPLEKVLAEMNVETSPQAALMWTATIVTAPRILPLLLNRKPPIKKEVNDA